MTIESLLYVVVTLAAVGGACDVIVLIVAVQMRREARRDRTAAGKLVDQAAEHGKTTDNVVARAVAEMHSGKSGEITLPSPPGPNGHRPRGCGALVVAGGVVAMGCALEGRADAAADMRRDGERACLEWWAAEGEK